MIIVPPAKALSNFKRGEDNHPITFHNKMLLHRNRTFTQEQFHEVGEIAREFLGFDISMSSVNAIMMLFPANYIRFSLNEEESEQPGYVHDSLCRFFMACPYPTYGDGVDIDAFLIALRSRAKDWFDVFGGE